MGLQVGSVGRDFFYFGEGQSRSQGLTAFDRSLVAVNNIFIRHYYNR